MSFHFLREEQCSQNFKLCSRSACKPINRYRKWLEHLLWIHLWGRELGDQGGLRTRGQVVYMVVINNLEEVPSRIVWQVVDVTVVDVAMPMRRELPGCKQGLWWRGVGSHRSEGSRRNTIHWKCKVWNVKDLTYQLQSMALCQYLHLLNKLYSNS